MAGNKIRLRVLTPQKQLYDEDIEMVILNASTGNMGILHGHIPLTTSLSYGVMRIIVEDKNEVGLTIFGGFAEITPDRVTVLSDAAEWPAEIDASRAMAAKERAEGRLREKTENTDLKRAELSLRRALVRIEVANSNSSKHV